MLLKIFETVPLSHGLKVRPCRQSSHVVYLVCSDAEPPQLSTNLILHVLNGLGFTRVGVNKAVFTQGGAKKCCNMYQHASQTKKKKTFTAAASGSIH